MVNQKKADKPAKTNSSFFTGVMVSIVLCIVYVKLGYSIPGWLQPANVIKQLVSDIAVRMAEDKQDLSEVQRGIALDLGWNPQKYIDLDTSLGHFISEEYFWHQRGRRRIQELRTKIKTINAELKKDNKHPDLMASLKRVQDNLPEEARQEHLFIKQYMKKRFPHDSDENINIKLASYDMDQLIQRPSISQAIHLETTVPTQVQVEILNSEGNLIRTIIHTELPTGQYWMYWDKQDNNGQKVPSGKYSYRVLFNGKQETVGSLNG